MNFAHHAPTHSEGVSTNTIVWLVVSALVTVAITVVFIRYADSKKRGKQS